MALVLPLLALQACGFGRIPFDSGDAALVDVDGDGYTTDEGDCDDQDPDVHPGATETCDGVDNDCDGFVDSDAEEAEWWYDDDDDDGYGDPDDAKTACGEPSGMVDNADDCDDTDPDTHAGADERCDEYDNDCDGEIDEGLAQWTYWRDTDGDGWGDAGSPTEACGAPSGYVDNDEDCDDADAEVGAATTWFPDDDDDGYGADAGGTPSCDPLAGRVDNALDCDDGDPAVNPEASETCDGVDDDCDGVVDEDDAADAPTWYADTDGDGYGDADSTTRACEAPSGTVADDRDCDDSDRDVHPLAAEVCADGIDRDCNGVVDNTCLFEVALADAAWSVVGLAPGDLAGTGLGIGDLDGDGVADLALGAPGVDGQGAAYLLTGGTGAAATLAGADARVTAQGPDDDLGATTAVVPDLDGDGYDELLLGAPGAASEAGTAYLLLGPVSGSVLAVEADLAVTGVSSGDALAAYVASSGDLDGDSTAELLLGAPLASGSKGALYVYEGSSGTLSASSCTATFAGSASALVGVTADARGDLDGDGVVDLVAGAPGAGSGGAVYAFHGPLTGTLSVGGSDLSISGAGAGDAFGSLVATADVDDDGHPDLVAADWSDDTRATDAGALMVFKGPFGATATSSASDFRLEGDTAHGALGHQEGAVATGDLDANGAADLVLGWLSEATAGAGAGGVFVVYGPMTGTWSVAEADAVVRGDAAAYLLGRALAVDDVDGDGTDDVLMGASAGSAGSGEVLLFLGPDLY